jgi:predicted amidohydrolase YtcJ
MRSLFAALVLAALAQAPTGPAPPCSGADVVVENARIVTMDGRDTVAGGMALEGERILYVGSADLARKCAAEDAKFVDVGGRTVLPGLIDVHTHAQEWA